MKPFVLMKLPMLFLCLGAALILSPRCKAQSEIAPDHFGDGPNTEPFEKVNVTTAAQTSAAGQKQATNPKAVVSAQAHSRKSNPAQTVQLTAARDLSQTTGQNAAVRQDKPRPPATSKSKDQ